MKNKRERSYERLTHILQAILDIEVFIFDIDEEVFLKDPLVASAVLFKFSVIGEAINHVERELLSKYDFPWHRVRAFRNLISHDYFNVKYIDNNHPPLIDEQKKELGQFRELISEYLETVLKLIKTSDFNNIDKILKKEQNVVGFIDSLSIQQIKRIKKQEVGTKNSLLYLGFMNESRNLILNSGKLIRAQRDFLDHNKGNGEKSEKSPVRIEQVN